MTTAQAASGRHFFVLVALASLALSGLAILRDPLINDDGVLYLVVAQSITERGFAGAFEIYDKPFYSMLIAALHGLSGISLLGSAHLLDAFFMAVLAVVFVRLAPQLTGDTGVQKWAAALVLLFPQLNEYRSFILRDFAYWALLLSSVLLLLRYLTSHRTRDGLSWGAALLLAAAFRPEALVFAVLLPAGCVLVQPGVPAGQRLRDCAHLYGCLATIVLPLLVALLLSPDSRAMLRGMPAMLLGAPMAIADNFAAASAEFAAHVLGAYAADQAPAALFAALLAVLCLRYLKTFGMLYSIVLAIGAWRLRPRFPSLQGRLLWLHALICVLILMGFLAHRQFLTGRYVIPLCLLSLFPLVIIVRDLFGRARARSHRLGTLVLLTGAALLAIDGFIEFGGRKTHVFESIAWMQDNIEPGARIFSNHRLLAFYSGGEFDWRQMSEAEALIAARAAPLEDVDYWIIQKTEGDELSDALLAYEGRIVPLGNFVGPGGRRITIYTIDRGRN